MAESGFNFSKLIEDSKAVLMNPKQYFSSMAKTGGFGDPIIKALIYGIVAGIIGLIWSLLNLSVGSFGGPIGTLFGYVIGAIIGLFISGIIILIISAICGGSTNFETNVRVAAALMVLLPVSALLGIFNALSLTLGVIISCIISLYGLYLLYVALVNSLGAKEGTAKIVTIILAAIVVLFLLLGLACGRGVTSMTNQTNQDLQKIQDQMKELQKLQEKMK